MRNVNLILAIFLLFTNYLVAQNPVQTPSEIDIIPYHIGQYWGFSNRQKELVIPAIYYEADFFNEYGLAKVEKRNPETEKMETGYINKAGEEIVKFGKYSYLHDYKDSLAVCNFYEKEPGIRKAGLVDMWGTEVLSKTYSRLKVMDNGLIWKVENGRIGVMDRKENIIIPIEYEAITEFTNSIALVRKDGKYGMMNDKGKVVIPVIYDALYEDNPNLLQEHIQKMDSDIIKQGLIPAKYGGKEGKWGMINLVGEIVIPFKYDKIGFFVNKVAVVRNNYDENEGECGLINIKGELVLPMEKRCFGDFKYGISSIWRDGKVGFINRNGDDVSSFKYDWADGFKDAVAVVEITKEIPNTGRYWGLVDSTGQEIVRCQYDKIKDFRDGLAVVVKNDKYGVINTEGDIVIPIKYAAAAVLNQYVMATVDGMNWGILDTLNTLVIPFKYNVILPIVEHPGIFRVSNFDPQNRMETGGYIDLDGNEYFE